MTATASDFFRSQQGFETVSRFYSGLSQIQIDRHMSLVSDAVDALTAGRQSVARKLKILDAGCGDGNQSPLLSALFNAVVLGITPFENEYMECLDKKARSAASPDGTPDLYKDVTFLKSGMPGLDGVDDNFDIVYSDCSFQYMKGSARFTALSRFAALAQNGIIALRYPDRPTFSPDSCHPSPEDFRVELSAFNQASSVKLSLLDLRTAPDTLAEKRPEKKIRMIEALLTPA